MEKKSKMTPDTVMAVFFGGFWLFAIVAVLSVVFLPNRRADIVEKVIEAAKEIEQDCPIKKEVEELRERIEKLEGMKK